MSLEQKINDGIKAAMLAKDKIRLETLRSIKAGILTAKTSADAVNFDSIAETKMLQKMVKQRRETAEIYLQNKRDELAEKETTEADIIEGFLPKQLSETEIKEQLLSIIANVQATSAKDMGKVMAVATKQLAGLADGKLVSNLVKELLA